MITIVLAIVVGALAVACLVLSVLLARRSAERGEGAVLASRLEGLERGQERIEKGVREELGLNRREVGQEIGRQRDEMRQGMQQSTEVTVRSIGEISSAQHLRLEGFATQMANLTRASEQRLEAVRGTVEDRLKRLQEENAARLDQIRQTVDEKLQGTLEKRLGDSFKLVSERLEQVHKGLGEMRELATGVGDLKRVLTNVKTRGTWGEIQLGALLEQILSPEQYGANVATRAGSQERVEFALKLPGKDETGESPVWLPIDAKFPKEEYERLLAAQERADPVAADEAGRRLEEQVRKSARDIRDKYLNPPATTDFGILFLPVEGLYAEVIRRDGLMELLQRDYRIVVAGPTTLAALLNSLQMGFRTLAIQRRSSEVWKLLGAVKSEFGKFGEILENVHKKLQQASDSIDDASKKSRRIEQRLRQVQELPASEAQPLLSGEADETPSEPV